MMSLSSYLILQSSVSRHMLFEDKTQPEGLHHSHHLLLIGGNHPAHQHDKLILLFRATFFNLLVHILQTLIRFTWDAFLILINTWADFTPSEKVIFIFIRTIAW